jgi:hypothetical protein
VFELVGEAEDDSTYSVDWGLAQGEDVADALPITLVNLQLMIFS